MKLHDPRSIAIAASSALLLLVAGLVVQHLRHGWPFSLHHGLLALRSDERPSASEKQAEARAASATHARVEVQVAQGQLETIGARIDTVREEIIAEPIRAVATVVPDEARVSHVHTRVAGWIERLDVATTGERVRAGQPLAGIFSQELLSTQAEYLAARRAAASTPRSSVADAARSRLRVLGMTDTEIAAIDKSGEPRRLVTVIAPRAGVVLHRGISVGTAVDPSTELITVADLSRVWVLAEVPEGDIPRVAVGTPAQLEFPASGREPIEAAVELLYPTLSERTRTLRVRFAVDNPSGSLRPGIYGNAIFRVQPRTALTVPRDAVVDTGNVQHVFVVAQQGRFVPRTVKLGASLDQRVEVLEGLVAGESIVASGVFLIDSESRLRASGGTGHVHGSTGNSAGAREQARTGHEGHGQEQEPVQKRQPRTPRLPASDAAEQAPPAPQPKAHHQH